MHPWIPVKSPEGATLRQAARVCFQQLIRHTKRCMAMWTNWSTCNQLLRGSVQNRKGGGISSACRHMCMHLLSLSVFGMAQRKINWIEATLPHKSESTPSEVPSVLVTFIPAPRHFRRCWFILPWIWMRIKPRSRVDPALQMGFHTLAAGFLRAPTPSSFRNLFWVYFLLVFLILK